QPAHRGSPQDAHHGEARCAQHRRAGALRPFTGSALGTLMRYVLALDQGTTSSRAIVFDEQGRPVASAQRELPQIYPQPGWVEHDPREIFTGQRDVARQALREAGVPMKDVIAIGIANQRETTLLWDRQSGEPLHNAI